jgi:hypothetical protein
MDLGTFGAIMGFALELEQSAADFYGKSPENALFVELAQGTEKRLQKLERARRENVAEMILESITGLDGDHYTVDLDAEGGDTAEQALKLEQAAADFYRAAAAKMPIREIVRLFERLAKENDQRKAKLEGVGD